MMPRPFAETIQQPVEVTRDRDREIDPDELAKPSEIRRNDGVETSSAHERIDVDEVASLYSTPYEERLSHCPRAERFEDERGESLALPDISTETGQRAADRLAAYGQVGIEFRDGWPDFRPVSECTVEIPDMTSSRPHNFSQADKLCAERWNAEKRGGRIDWDAGKVKQWRRDNGFSWHECEDMKTMNLVSQDIHGYFSHCGGVTEYYHRQQGGAIGNGEFDD